jgi:hypothetical protein
MIGFNTYLFSPALCIRFSWFLLLRRASSTLCLLHFLQLLLFPFHCLQLVRQFVLFFLQLLIIFPFLLFVANCSASPLALEAAPAQVLQEELLEELLEEVLPALSSHPLSE